MDKEQLRRIDLKNRTKLETVIPLETPFIINVDPADSCNFQCSFCPTGDRKLMKDIGRPFRTMKWEIFTKIIDDLKEFEQPIKVLRLYKDGEPLLNPRFADMVKYAKDSGKVLKVDTTTNASLLNPKRNIEIIEAGLDKINISVEGVNAEQYMNFSKYKIDFDNFVENIKHFYENKKQCEVVVKINGDTLNEDDKKFFMETFKDIADGVYIEHIMSCWPEFELRDGLEVNQEHGIYGQEIKEVSVCPYVFYSFSLNSDGQASLCFLDWSRKLLIGDVREESVKSIWLGQRMKEYQKMFLRHERKKHPVCKDCGQMSHGMPDDIDSFADEILKKLG
ncbi:radical SAM protein [Aliarcobacter cryaerophilus]|uniref:radical SAM/SPASM domain-containing protein n=1 Tax=Aliarcobacter cryaerophilus TaxID=28198 RepID=UPI0021B511D4|nr:radical SAM/SPASM domain-containing protein [Aliarcobacter cryaerophilus]MCT7539716.1 radical SAM protein [Aliarcobacter cryaerophilus]